MSSFKQVLAKRMQKLLAQDEDELELAWLLDRSRQARERIRRKRRRQSNRGAAATGRNNNRMARRNNSRGQADPVRDIPSTSRQSASTSSTATSAVQIEKQSNRRTGTARANDSIRIEDRPSTSTDRSSIVNQGGVRIVNIRPVIQNGGFLPADLLNIQPETVDTIDRMMEACAVYEMPSVPAEFFPWLSRLPSLDAERHLIQYYGNIFASSDRVLTQTTQNSILRVAELSYGVLNVDEN